MCHFKKSDWPILTCAAIFAILLLGVGQPIEFISIFLMGVVLALPMVFGLFIPSLLQAYSKDFVADIGKGTPEYKAVFAFIFAQIIFFLLFQWLGLSNNLGFFSGLMWLVIVTLLTYGAFYLYCLKASCISNKYCKLGFFVVGQGVIAFCFFFSTAVIQSHFMIASVIPLMGLMTIAVALMAFFKNRKNISKSMMFVLSYVLVLLLLSCFRNEDLEHDSATISAGISVPEVISVPKMKEDSKKTDDAMKTKQNTKASGS